MAMALSTKDFSPTFPLHVTTASGDWYFVRISGRTKDKKDILKINSLFQEAKFDLDRGVGQITDISQINEGHIYAARYNEGFYGRARIIRIHNSEQGMVEIKFIDYGKQALISLMGIKSLDQFDPLFMQLSDQSTDYYLSDVIRPTGIWHGDILLKLHGLLSGSEYPITINVGTDVPFISLIYQGKDLATYLASYGHVQKIPIETQVLLYLQLIKSPCSRNLRPNFSNSNNQEITEYLNGLATVEYNEDSIIQLSQQLELSEQIREDNLNIPKDQPQQNLRMPKDQPQQNLNMPEDQPQQNLNMPEDQPQQNLNMPEDQPQQNLRMPEDQPQQNLNMPEDQPQQNLNMPEDQPQQNLNMPEDQPQQNLNMPEDQSQQNLNIAIDQPGHNLNIAIDQPEPNLDIAIDQPQHSSLNTSNSFKYYLMRVNSRYRVYVSYANDGPEMFSVQLISRNEKLSEMMEQINNEPLCNLTEPPMIGKAVLGRMSEDQLIYRAVIMKIGLRQCQLHFVDYGDKEIVAYHDIFEIPKKYMKPNPFALTLRLSKIQELVKSSKLIEDFKELVKGRALIAKLVKSEEPLMQFVELYSDDDKYENIFDSLRSNMRDRMEFEKFRMLPVGVTRIVQVCHVESCLKFYVQLCDKAKEFYSLLQVLQRVYKSNCSPNELYSGASCCARFLDGNWHRARVQEVKGPKVKVVCVDFGIQRELDISDIRAITPNFMRLPAMAIKCTLKGFENRPVQPNTCKYMKELALEKFFTCCVTGCLPSGAMLVTLIEKKTRVLRLSPPPLSIYRSKRDALPKTAAGIPSHGDLEKALLSYEGEITTVRKRLLQFKKSLKGKATTGTQTRTEEDDSSNSSNEDMEVDAQVLPGSGPSKATGAVRKVKTPKNSPIRELQSPDLWSEGRGISAAQGYIRPIVPEPALSTQLHPQPRTCHTRGNPSRDQPVRGSDEANSCSLHTSTSTPELLIVFEGDAVCAAKYAEDGALSD